MEEGSDECVIAQAVVICTIIELNMCVSICTSI